MSVPISEYPADCVSPNTNQIAHFFRWTLAGAIQVSFVLYLLQQAARENFGAFCYMLDDAYIHMTIARNLAESGCWGIQTDQFASASSSPLWVLLLYTCYALLPYRDLVPLLVNIFASILILYRFSLLLRQCGWDGKFTGLIILLLISLIIPLPYLILTGMEHVLQLLFNLFFLAAFDRFCRSGMDRPPIRYLLFASAAVTAIRYEGGFLIISAVLVLLGAQKFRAALSTLAAGLIPSFLYACFSLSRGGYFMPNPVLIKGRGMPGPFLEQLLPWFSSWNTDTAQNIHLLLLMLAVLALCLTRPPAMRAVAIVFVGTCLLHLAFAGNGYFYLARMFIRYDCYLVGMGAWVLLRLLPPIPELRRRFLPVERQSLLLLFLLLFCQPLLWRGIQSCRIILPSIQNVYDMHYSLGTILAAEFQGAAVAVHDIGMVNYLARLRCLDLYGLADRSVADAILHNRYDVATRRRLVREAGIDLVIVWAKNFRKDHGPLPDDWLPVGELIIPHNKIMYEDRWTFLVPRPDQASEIIKKLKRAVSLLPQRVTIKLMEP